MAHPKAIFPSVTRDRVMAANNTPLVLTLNDENHNSVQIVENSSYFIAGPTEQESVADWGHFADSVLCQGRMALVYDLLCSPKQTKLQVDH
jgi:hypothetical protein